VIPPLKQLVPAPRLQNLYAGESTPLKLYYKSQYLIVFEPTGLPVAIGFSVPAVSFLASLTREGVKLTRLFDLVAKRLHAYV